MNTAPGVCAHLDGSNAENKISLIMVKCLNIGKNISQPIYRSISSFFPWEEKQKTLKLKHVTDVGMNKRVFSNPSFCISQLCKNTSFSKSSCF